MKLGFLHLFALVIALFSIGSVGVFIARRNIITTLISIELMLLACSLGFISASLLMDDSLGIIYALFILTIAGAESAIGLAILVSFYRTRGTITLDMINYLNG